MGKSKGNAVLCVLHVLAFINPQVVMPLATASAPKPVDILVFLDVGTHAGFNTAISAVQVLDMIPGSRLTALSTDREKPLLTREKMDWDDSEWKSTISRVQLSSSKVDHLTLERLRALTAGHFNNEDKTHNEAQIVLILTDQNCMFGDIALVQVIRKKKTFIIPIGFPKTELDRVYQSLAADEEHVLPIEKPSDLDNWIEQMKIEISKDSLLPCDTDTYRRSNFKNCDNNECKDICYSTEILERRCTGPCPYYKVVNVSALEIERNESADKDPTVNWASFAVPISFGVLGLIVLITFVVLCITSERFREMVKNLVRRLLEGILSVCRRLTFSQVPPDDPETGKIGPIETVPDESNGNGQQRDNTNADREEDEAGEQGQLRDNTNADHAEDGEQSEGEDEEDEEESEDDENNDHNEEQQRRQNEDENSEQGAGEDDSLLGGALGRDNDRLPAFIEKQRIATDDPMQIIHPEIADVSEFPIEEENRET